MCETLKHAKQKILRKVINNFFSFHLLTSFTIVNNKTAHVRQNLMKRTHNVYLIYNFYEKRKKMSEKSSR